MKNLKNMLFAAAIGAVAIALPATASAADTCTINTVDSEKVLNATADCNYNGSETIKTLTITEGKKITFGNGAKLTYTTEGSTLTAAGVKANTNYAIYQVVDTDAGTTTLISAREVDIDIKPSVISTAADYKWTMPTELTYGKIASVKVGDDEATATPDAKKAIISSDKKSVTIKKGFSGAIKITVDTGVIGGADTKVFDIDAIEAVKADDEANQAVQDAMIKDYIDVLTKNSEAVVGDFATKVKDATAVADIKAAVTAPLKVELGAEVEANTTKIKNWATKNGYTVLFGFTETLANGITATPSPVKVSYAHNSKIEAPALAGKNVKWVVLTLHNSSTPKVLNATVDGKLLSFESSEFSSFALAYTYVDPSTTPATDETKTDSTETTTGDATKEANPKTSDHVMTSVVSLLVSAFGLTAAGLKLKNN